MSSSTDPNMSGSASVMSSSMIPSPYDSTVSLSEHVHRKLAMCVSVGDKDEDARQLKSQALESLMPFVKEVDAYIDIAAGGAELPDLDWNRQFRKAYNIMFWIRPQICTKVKCQCSSKKNTAAATTGGTDSSKQNAHPNKPRILYQFSTHPDEDYTNPSQVDVMNDPTVSSSSSNTIRNKGLGVSVTANPWTLLESGTGNGKVIRTTLLAQCLPATTSSDSGMEYYNNNNSHHEDRTSTTTRSTTAASAQQQSQHDMMTTDPTMTGGSVGTRVGSYVSCPFQLTVGKWSLVGINHVFPYLKRPQWTLCVDGRIMGTGELNYPVLEKSTMMYNSLLDNLMKDGAIAAGSGGNSGDDDTQSASSSSSSSSSSSHYNLHMHVATVALHPDAIPPSIQALLAEAGPSMSLQQQGRILAQLPPVSNWSKGSSLEGPNVGIPLCTSVQALELQRLASRVIYAYSAACVRVLGTLHSKNPRILLAASTSNGDTDQTPKVGLIQPSPVYVEPDAPLKFLGSGVTVHHSLSEFLLYSEDGAMVDTQLGLDSSKLLSVILLEQSAVPSSILPFFRSLVPPGFLVRLQDTLYKNSLRELWNLYSNNGALAAQYIMFLATMVQYGGGRVHEEVLQSGILHILATTLRRSLVRAYVLGIFGKKSKNKEEDTECPTLETFLSQIAKHREADLQTLSQKEDIGSTSSSSTEFSSSSSTTTTSTVVCPAVIPMPVAEACVYLIHACCGPPSPSLDRLTPAMKVRRSSDLALTAIFGFVLDFDLWGDQSLVETELVLRALAERYGGGDISYGVVLRSQIPIQSFLDLIKLRFDSIYMTKKKKKTVAVDDDGGDDKNHDGTNDDNDEDDEDYEALLQIANHLSQLLFSMILASFSNRRVITQAEHDVAACMGALSDSPLGSVGCHVVLTALELVLKWCDILPATTMITDEEEDDDNQEQGGSNTTSATNSQPDRRFGGGNRAKSQSLLDIHEKNNAEQERKMQVAARLGRNLLMAQYHDVVAPMLLSRTIFCGERTMMKETTTTSQTKKTSTVTFSKEDDDKDKKHDTKCDTADNDNVDDDDDDSCLSWKHHWRIALLLFAWVTSISGVDGEISAKSTGSLLLASSLAGSLKGCLVSGSSGTSGGKNKRRRRKRNRDENQMVALLLLPPPVMALTVGSGDSRNRDKTGSWSYVDLLTDRLRIAVPLLPGLVVSLVSHPQDTTIPSSLEGSDPMDHVSLGILSELITAIGSSFQRVYGSLSTTAPKATTTKKRIRNRRKSLANSAAVKAAKDNAPSLLIVLMLLENHIELRRPVLTAAAAVDSASSDEKDKQDPSENATIVEVFSPLSKPSDDVRSAETDWVDVPTIGKSIVWSNNQSSSKPITNISKTLTVDVVLRTMISSQRAILDTVSDLIVNAMRHGGGEASTIVWRSVITALQESVAYSKKQPTPAPPSNSNDSGGETRTESEFDPQGLAKSVLCRLAALVLTKLLPKEYEDDMWPLETCAAVSRLCDLIEEKELLQIPRGTNPKGTGSKVDDDGSSPRPYSPDQICLLYAMLEIMTFGREMGGWNQFTQQVADGGNNEDDLGGSKNSLSLDDTFVGRPSSRHNRTLASPNLRTPMSVTSSGVTEDASSQLLLPILQPCLRILLGCLGCIRSTLVVRVPLVVGTAPSEQQEETGDRSSKVETVKVPLLSQLANELRHSLIDAIVGLSFPNSRDVALNTLASLRRANVYQQNANDDDAIKICSFLFVAIAEEIRVRYDGERQRRQHTLFDAYEYDDDKEDGKGVTDRDGTEQASAKSLASEAQSSQEVERMILGGDLIPDRTLGDEKQREVETITFDDSSNHSNKSKDDDPPLTPPAQQRNRATGGSEDFVMFPDSAASNTGADDANVTQLGWSHYKGLGSALEKCSKESQSMVESGHEKQVEAMLSILSSYLDTWDESVARESAESELVELFDQAVTVQDEVGKRSNATAPLSPKPSSMSSSSISSDLPSMPIMGTETAADAMTNFIELSAIEKSRLKEVASTFLPARRYSCMSFVERYCWAQYMEFVTDASSGSMDKLWERCTADGNRDVRSRLISMPCNPQFRRYIPAYLDHGPSSQELIPEGEVEEDEEVGDQDNENEEKKRAAPRHIVSTEDLEFQKALAESTNVAIVDITKQEQEEEEEEESDALEVNQDLTYEEDSDDEGVEDFLGFPSKEETDIPENANHGGEAYLGFPDKNEGQRQESGDNKIDAGAETVATKESSQVEPVEKADNVHHNIASSSFSHPPDNSSSTISLLHSSAARMIELHFDNCVHVKTEGCRECTILLSATHLILEYDAEAEGLFDGEMLATQDEADRQRLIDEAGGNFSQRAVDDIVKRHRETAALRPKSMRFNLSELSHVYLRRYRLRDSALEMFFLPSGGSSFGGFGLYAPATSLFLDFGPGYEGNIRRDDAAHAIMKRAPPQTIKQWPDRSGQFLHEQLSRLTMGWVEGRITNFDYLLHLNILAGRSYNDLCQYPVMPWVLSNYHSTEIPDLTDKKNFRDLSKPVGALNPDRLEDFIERFESFADQTIPPFMYGSHYSTSAGVVLHFLVRMHPFAGLHRSLQGGHFDVADRLFSSVPRTWDMCTGASAAEVKELTPEWYCNPSFLKNTNNFKLGTSQDGELLDDVRLPPWANNSPEKFIEVMRDALESDICSEMLPNWIDLIFGRKQQGPEAIKAHNVFFYLTYYGSVDVASIEDPALRQATELQIAHFGQCPMQLFRRPHVHRVQRWRNFRRQTFYQMLSAYTQGAARGEGEGAIKPMLKKDGSQRVIGEPLFLPFLTAPISHWVHLAAPPPGPHADLIAVRLAGVDRCLAVDSQGIFHSFRWAWKPEEETADERLIHQANSGNRVPIDRGCFVAQRELPRFRAVPRLPHVPTKRAGDGTTILPAIGISKTLFAGRTVLLVLSDGDGRGALSMQLVDPAKGSVRGQAIVSSVHSSRITCIAMDPIGTAAGHGGVGGELAMLGSADGGASIWRFMSSHYFPLRPRVRMHGHQGSKIHAVALSGAIHVCASVSDNRCCIFSIGNGAMIRSFSPPQDTLDASYLSEGNLSSKTVFADTPALCLSVQGFLVCVCKTILSSSESESFNRVIITLHLFSLEGVSLGSKALESWRGMPHKITCTPDGTAITVCAGRGITIHRLSAITPLEFIDEWHVAETEALDENLPKAWDVDFGPSIMRPIVGAAACSSGALRLHALPGISAWSEKHKRSSVASQVGQALAKPAQRIKNAFGKGLGLGNKVVGVGKEIGKEVSSDVKEKGVSGFLGGFMSRKSKK